MKRGMLFAVVTVAAMTAHAVQPVRLNYQAKLTGSGGGTYSGLHTLYYSLFQGGDANTSDSGTSVYGETDNPTLVGGIVNHAIGTGTPLSGDLNSYLFSYNGDMFIQVAVDSPSNIILPRTRLESSPFAIAKAPASLFGQFGGSGVEGDHIVSGIETYMADDGRHEYKNLSVPPFSQLNTGNKFTYIGVQGVCAISSTIDASGQGEAGCSGIMCGGGTDATGLALSASPVSILCASGAGGGGSGNGSNSSGTPGGGAQGSGGLSGFGMGQSASYSNRGSKILSGLADPGSGRTTTDNFAPLLAYAGAGGGQGVIGEFGSYGTGGNGGGVLYIECGELQFSSLGLITAAGAPGIGGITASGGHPGSGGGGGGGVVLIRARKVTVNMGQVTVSGGAGGPASTNVLAGGAGALGFWDIVEVH